MAITEEVWLKLTKRKVEDHAKTLMEYVDIFQFSMTAKLVSDRPIAKNPDVAICIWSHAAMG